MAFVIVLAVLAYNFWYEAWSHNWRSNTVWRERLWIPYAAMPAGLMVKRSASWVASSPTRYHAGTCTFLSTMQRDSRAPLPTRTPGNRMASVTWASCSM